MEPVIDLTKDSDPGSDPGSDSGSDSDVLIVEKADPEANPMTELDYTADAKPQCNSLMEAVQAVAEDAGKSKSFKAALDRWVRAPTQRNTFSIRGESKAIQALHHAGLLGQGKEQQWKNQVSLASALQPLGRILLSF